MPFIPWPVVSLRGENIFPRPHRSHIYQRLHQAGWPHGQVAGLYIGATLAIAFGLWQFGTCAAWGDAWGQPCLALVAGELLFILEPQGQYLHCSPPCKRGLSRAPVRPVPQPQQRPGGIAAIFPPRLFVWIIRGIGLLG